ncbi:FAD-dependent monooxygenase [Priestia filamentosa]|uniref:FAD-dependent oxidoreductase n=1 Tax=Priestia filamentosa TaxID=1402861 RepID=UPI00058959FC
MEILKDRVLIVGGGPVGLSLALVLAKYKIYSVILEEREEPTSLDESRAITWMPRGLEFLNWLGIEQRFLKEGLIRYYHQFESPKQPLLTWSFKAIQSPYPYSLQVPQHKTEILLQESALETGFVEIRRGHKVINLTQNSNQVSVTVEHEAKIYELCTPWGVGCDGSKSKVREELSIRKHWRDYGMYSVVADFEMDCSLDKELSNIVLDPKRPYGFFYFAPGCWRFIYRINKGEDRQTTASKEFASKLIKEKLPNACIHRPLWISSFRLGQGQSDTYQKGRWLLAGDAAHAMGPSAGAGMMVGVLGAWRLGWRLALVMKNNPQSSLLLQDYSREQHDAADEIQGNNAIIFKNMSIKKPIIATIRSFFMKNILSKVSKIENVALEKEALLRQALPVISSTDYHIPKGWITSKRIGPWILGQRIPYIVNESSFNPLDFTDLGYTIFSIGKSDKQKERELFQHLMDSLKLPTDVKVVTPDEKSLYRVKNMKFIFVVVRPDQHILSILEEG